MDWFTLHGLFYADSILGVKLLSFNLKSRVEGAGVSRKYLLACIFFCSAAQRLGRATTAGPGSNRAFITLTFFANFSLLILPLWVLAVIGVITYSLDVILANLQPSKGDKNGE